jgi:hypothetical protein
MAIVHAAVTARTVALSTLGKYAAMEWLRNVDDRMYRIK